MRRITIIILLIIMVLCSGCYAKRAFSGGNIGLLENVKSISLEDSTMIFINAPVLIRNDKENNNLIIQTRKDIQIIKIPKDNMKTIYSKHFSFGYALRARILGR